MTLAAYWLSMLSSVNVRVVASSARSISLEKHLSFLACWLASCESFSLPHPALYNPTIEDLLITPLNQPDNYSLLILVVNSC